MLPFVEVVLSKFDMAFSHADWYTISSELHNAVQDQQLTPLEQEEFDAEFLAFRVIPRRERHGLETYFVLPEFLYTSKGENAGTPKVSQFALNLWRDRAATSKSPIRRARYADLVWDLGRLVEGQTGRDHRLAKVAIEAYLEIVVGDHLEYPITGNDLLDRALDIAASLGNATKVSEVVEIILTRGENATPSGTLGIWMHPAEALLSSKHLSSGQRVRLLHEMEKRFRKATDDLDKFAADRSLPALLSLYPKRTALEDRQRILGLYSAMHRRVAESSSAMLAVSFLLRVVELLEDNQLPDEADELRVYVEERAAQVEAEMTMVSTESTLDKAALDDETDKLVNGFALYPALYRISRYVMPKLAEVRRQLEWARENTPLQFLITRVSFGQSGLPVSLTSGSSDDNVAQLSAQYGRHIPISALFFKLRLDRIRLKHIVNADTLMNALEGCPLIHVDRWKILREGLLAHESGDYLKAIHVLVPQVEMILRQLLRFIRIPTSKAVRDKPGVTELKNMNDVFRDSRVTEILDEDLRAFLLHLYVDKHGYNLRNDLCHGIATEEVFNEHVSGLVLQSIILLAAIRKRTYIYQPRQHRGRYISGSVE
jgi:hypothetical protein